jgi:hypothetical protein
MKKYLWAALSVVLLLMVLSVADTGTHPTRRMNLEVGGGYGSVGGGSSFDEDGNGDFDGDVQIDGTLNGGPVGGGDLNEADIDTEAELEAILTDVTNVFTNNDTVPDGNVADDLTMLGGTVNNTPIGAATPSTGAFTTLMSPFYSSNVVGAGGLVLRHIPSSGNGLVQINPQPLNETSDALLSLFRSTNTSGGKNVFFYSGNNTTNTAFQFTVSTTAPIFYVYNGATTPMISFYGATGNIVAAGSADFGAGIQSGSGNVQLTDAVGFLSTSIVTSDAIAAGAIADSHVNASAAIARSKLAVKTPILLSAGNGNPTTSGGCTAAAMNANDQTVLTFATTQQAVWDISALPSDFDGSIENIVISYRQLGTTGACTFKYGADPVAEGTDPVKPTLTSFGADTPGAADKTYYYGPSASGMLGTSANANLEMMIWIQIDIAAGGDVELLGVKLEY